MTLNGTEEGLRPLLSLDELRALRTDFQDVSVPELGGTELRVYALTGTARATFVSEMADLAGEDEEKASKDPAVVRRVFLFQGRVVAASLGYPSSEWDGLGDVLGARVIERLFDVSSSLSALNEEAQQKAVARLGRARKRASGTGSPSH